MLRRLQGVQRPSRLRLVRALALATAVLPLGWSLPAPAQPQDPGAGGIRLNPGGSAVRNIVPAEVIEQQAVQEYEQLKQEAIAKRALAPDNHPQLVRLRAIGKRLLPQTAGFYRLVGLEVNLRGLAFKDIKITYETVDAKPVLVIEGMIMGETREPVGIPRLRFSVRDAQGAEVYAWNAVLEQSVLKPGDRAWFKSRLASPPPEGRTIDIRFFNKRDVAAGQA